MWQVINKSSGIVAYSNSERGQAHYWWMCNNFTEDGDDLCLYQLVRGS